MWILWMTVAHADQALTEPCTVSFAGSIPAAGATGVPVDVRPVVVFDTEFCGGGESEVQLVDLETDEPEDVVVSTIIAESQIAVVVEPADLAADHRYRLVVDHGGVRAEVPFVTGDDLAPGDGPAAPEVVFHEVWDEDCGVMGYILDVAGAGPDTIVITGDADHPTGVFVAPLEGPFLVSTHKALASDEALCETVTVQDPAGRRSEPVEVCTEIEALECNFFDRVGCDGGCAMGGRPASGLIGLALALAGIRRRRV